MTLRYGLLRRQHYLQMMYIPCMNGQMQKYYYD